jgi:hypothetical protein
MKGSQLPLPPNIAFALPSTPTPTPSILVMTLENINRSYSEKRNVVFISGSLANEVISAFHHEFFI